MCTLLDQWKRTLINDEKSQNTIEGYIKDVELLLNWIKEKKGFTTVTIEEIKTITALDLQDFMYYLKEEKKPKPDCASTRARRVSSIQNFYRYLVDIAELLTVNEDISRKLKAPSIPKRKPVYVNSEEAQALINAVGKRNQIRNKAIIVMFVTTGLRLSELISVNVDDIQGDMLTVIGKGDKEREIELNDIALKAINDWLNIRSKYNPKDNALFISENGTRITKTPVQEFISRCFRKINKGGSVHSLRHGFCTIMLENGADLAMIQEMAGHENIQTTMGYTHVLRENKKKVVNRIVFDLAAN